MLVAEAGEADWKLQLGSKLVGLCLQEGKQSQEKGLKGLFNGLEGGISCWYYLLQVGPLHLEGPDHPNIRCLRVVVSHFGELFNPRDPFAGQMKPPIYGWLSRWWNAKSARVLRAEDAFDRLGVVPASWALICQEPNWLGDAPDRFGHGLIVSVPWLDHSLRVVPEAVQDR